MPRLMRLHFASIGHSDARLSPLTLDFREDGHGSGVDTVLWLRNGGGKSSILNLFFSLLRPGAREFLGSTAEGKSRRLSDYVKDNDLAFVISEWDLAPQIDMFDSTPPRVHVLGQMLSWKGLQRSPDESRLRKLLFGFRSGPELGLDDLPVRGLAEPVGSFEAFREWLAGQKGRNPALEVQYTDTASTWRTYLGQLGLDPELMKVQIQMNAREGAADESFRFQNANEFVNFFLELAMDLDKASEVSANLETFRSGQQQRPVLQLERKLFDEALPPLRELAAAVETQAAARRHLAEITETAAGTARGLRQRVESFERRANDHRIAHAEAQKRLVTPTTRRPVNNGGREASSARPSDSASGRPRRRSPMRLRARSTRSERSGRSRRPRRSGRSNRSMPRSPPSRSRSSATCRSSRRCSPTSSSPARACAPRCGAATRCSPSTNKTLVDA